MMEHLNDIDHIIHDLEQIEQTSFDDKQEIEPLEHTRILATEVIKEFMDLLRALELEEFEHSGIVYDSEMIHKMCLTAYYISRFDYQRLFEMNLTLEETCEHASKLIGCNPEALLHMKSLYSDFYTNIEMGWKQNVTLTSDMIRIMKECQPLSEYEVALECKAWFRK